MESFCLMVTLSICDDVKLLEISGDDCATL